ncbi:TPA: hypothetical protein UL921_002363 [Stenotrophomonas maltophilia]|nr:hypothetical protein [Stenotrophomonas maltophilia]
MIPWYLDRKVWLLAALVTIAALLYWRGGSDARDEARELRQEAKQTAKSNEISRGTQQRIGIEGYEVQKRAKADDRTLRQGADPAAAPADDDGMRIADQAHKAALRAACRVRGEKSCDGASGP